MQRVKTLRDLRKLQADSNFPQSFLDYLETYFFELAEALGNGESAETFSLEQHGYFLILEPRDNLAAPNILNLKVEDGKILGTYPEYVEREDLTDCSLYKIGILYDNDYMMMVFSQVGQFEPAIESWWEEESNY